MTGRSKEMKKQWDDQKKLQKQWEYQKEMKETMGGSKDQKGTKETMGGSKKRKKQWENEKNNEDNVRNNSSICKLQ